MGCGCYEGKKRDEIINKKRRNKITDSSDKNSNMVINKMKNLSSISSFISENSINIKGEKRNKLTDKINNNNILKKYRSANKPFINEKIICNISIINFNNKEKEKLEIKINKTDKIKDLANLLQIEANKLYNIKGHAFLYHKGIKVQENEIINNLLINQDEIINLNLTDGNENNENKKLENNEINFEAILIPLEEEELIIKEKLSNEKKENGDTKNIQEYNLTKKIISYLFPKCNHHKDEKLNYICLTCYNSFCEHGYEEHKTQFQEHEIINKNKLIELNFEVKNIKRTLINKYGELVFNIDVEKIDKNQINYISTNDLFAKIKIEINDIQEKMDMLFHSIREKYQKINLKFLTTYEEKMPKIIEFSEYVDKTLTSFDNLNIFSNENMFIEIYDNYLNIKNITDKYYNNIISLKEIIIKYKEFLESFKKKGNNLFDYVKQGIDNIIKSRNSEKIFNSSSRELFQSNVNENNLNKNNNINNKIFKNNDISLNTTKDLNQSINLRFLFSDKKQKKAVTFRKDINNSLFKRGISTLFKQKNKTINELNKSNMMEDDNIINLNLDNKQITNDNQQIMQQKKFNLGSPNISLNSDLNIVNKFSSNLSSLGESKINIYSLIYGSNKMIRFNSKLKKLEIISPDLSDLTIIKFETYISKLNFKNKFYISGGYNAPKAFSEYDSNTNKFIQLTNMITNHYYHNMIGYKNYIYSISGFKSKKVEKFSLVENQWISLPDLEYERTYPNSLIYNDNLFVFGKINNIKEELNSDINIIEYINLKDYIPDDNKKWTKIELKSNFPFNSGIIKLDNTNILVGGKLDLNENCINLSYSMQIENINNNYEINIKLNDLKLKEPDEFGGNNFYALDEIGEIFGNFSLVNPYLFYIFDKNVNKFTNLEYSEQKDDI